MVTIRPKRKSIFTGNTVPSGGAEVSWVVCSPADRAPGSSSGLSPTDVGWVYLAIE